MDQSDAYFEKLESILDKEQEYLHETQREHHTNWDRHVLTLATAAVAFSVTFLPLSGSWLLCLAVFGILSFVLSIIFSTIGFLASDRGLELASASYLARRLQQDKVRHRVNRLKRDMQRLNSQDVAAIDAARAQCWTDVEGIYGERDPDKELANLKKNGRLVKFLNHARTYCFLFGIIAITVYALCNIDLFAAIRRAN